MTTSLGWFRAFIVPTVVLLVIGTFLGFAQQTEVKTFTVEITEDGTRFVAAASPVLADGAPAYGNAYVAQGYIYPEGTLVGGDSGILEDGSPAYPEKVLGEWTGWGYFTGRAGTYTAFGPIAVANELFDFGEERGRETILLSGVLVVPAHAVAPMAIIGGTGPYAYGCGEADREVLNWHEAHNSLQTRYTFKIASCSR